MIPTGWDVICDCGTKHLIKKGDLNMKICTKCKKEFDPAYDFCEDFEKVEALMYFAEEDLNDLCGHCSYDLVDHVRECIYGFFKENR